MFCFSLTDDLRRYAFSDWRSTMTDEKLLDEFDYYRAQKALEELLKCGLISLLEFNKITELNRKSFSPFLAEIMPDNR